MICNRLIRWLLQIWKIFFAVCIIAISRETSKCTRAVTPRKMRRSRFGKLIPYSWLVCILTWMVLVVYCLIIYYTDKQRFGYTVPDTCVDESCQVLSPPADGSMELSPNLLMILIHASVAGVKRREAIRRTWAKEINNRDTSPVQYRFVLGGLDVSPHQLEQLNLESEMHGGDIIVLPSVTDSLYTLTKRTLHGFKYAYEHFKFNYILKCDDDSFVDVLRVAYELQKNTVKGQPLYWGAFCGGCKVLYFGTYSESHWSICKSYLPYAFGGGYILSRDLIQLLAENELYLKQYKSEDVSVGAWLSPYNIECRHDSRFNTQGSTKGCKWPYLISHKVSASFMYQLQNSLTTDGTFCSQRTYFHRRHGFVYNWTVKSSRCCLTNSDIP